MPPTYNPDADDRAEERAQELWAEKLKAKMSVYTDTRESCRYSPSDIWCLATLNVIDANFTNGVYDFLIPDRVLDEMVKRGWIRYEETPADSEDKPKERRLTLTNVGLREVEAFDAWCGYGQE